MASLIPADKCVPCCPSLPSVGADVQLGLLPGQESEEGALGADMVQIGLVAGVAGAVGAGALGLGVVLARSAWEAIRGRVAQWFQRGETLYLGSFSDSLKFFKPLPC